MANWNDLSVLLAVQRGGSLSQAARLLGFDKSTVSRRVAALEADLGASLVERYGRGRTRLTSAGQKAARRAEAMEDAMRALANDLQGAAPGAAGRVRLTAVPLVVNHLLLPKVPELLAGLPGVSLELVSEARDLDLMAGDADLAIRLARPQKGGQGVLTRRIGALNYQCFAASDAETVPWIGYEPHMGYLSHAAAIETLAAQRGEPVSALSVNDAETLLHAVRCGQGKTLLPYQVGVRAGLHEHPLDAPLPKREVWLLTRRDIRGLARIQAVTAWVEACLS